jgi:O-antigen ligase
VLVPKLALVSVPGDPTPIRVDDVVLGVVLGGWTIARLLSRDRSRTPSPITPFFVLYAFVVVATTLLAIGAETTRPGTAALHFLRLVEYALLYYVFYDSIELSELGDVVRVLRFTLAIVVLVWAVQHWTAASVGTIIDWATLYPTFSATYDFGGYVMLATVVLYALWSTGSDRGPMTTGALLIGLYLLVNADSRASFMGIVVAIVFDLFLRMRWQVALGLVSVTATIPYVINSKKMEALLDVIVALATSFNADTVQRAFLSDPSIGLRLRNWQMALERWAQHPLTGDGLGGYLQFVRIYDQPGTPDGWYIRLLNESGLLGLLAFVLLIGALMWILLSAYRRQSDPLRRAMVYGAALAVVAASTNALLIDTFVSYKIMGVFWMIVAVGTRVAADRPPSTERAAGPAPLPELSPA